MAKPGGIRTKRSPIHTGTTGTTVPVHAVLACTRTHEAHRQSNPTSSDTQRMKIENVRPKSQAGTAETRPTKRFDWPSRIGHLSKEAVRR